MQLSNITTKAIFSIAFISIFLTLIISVIFQMSHFESDLEKLRSDYIKYKEDEIKREVIKVFNRIESKEKQITNEIQSKLKFRINIAHEIASAIYNENKNKKTDEEIKYLIVSALKNISFSERRSYYFINSNEGRAILFNKQSKLNENKNVWNLKDKTGKYFIQEQSKIALEKGEGFLQTHFVKPDLEDNIQYPKLSYIKIFKPFNWHIGMGEYIDDLTFNTKEDILKDIASIRYTDDGYIFVNSVNKKALVFDGYKLNKPRDYTNNELFNKQINTSENKEGGFFYYKFKKLNTTKKFPKLAFVKRYEKWGWIIGSGVYIDEIDEEIEKRKEEYIEHIIEQITVTLIAILVLLILLYLVSKKMSKHLDKNIRNLTESFKNASKNHKEMNTDRLSYEEFKNLGESLNLILKSRNKTEKKLQDYIQIVNENVIISSTDINGMITNANEAFCRISGYTKDELIGKSHNIVKHEDMSDEFFKQMWETITKGDTWEGEIKNKSKTGDSYWVKTIIKPIFKDEKIKGFTAIRQDISDKKRVEYLSITDELTNLKNRRCFNQTIKDEINRAKRDNHYLAFMMLDIDYFKKYNDTYGHQAGDLALKRISAVLLKHTKRASDFAFRLGGEEFGIIFYAESEEDAVKFATLIKNDIQKLQIKHEASEIESVITTSLGLVIKKGSQILSSDEMYKLADEALYEAKSAGRNKVIISS